MNTFERLENWSSAHKKRSVEIIQGDGYSATCWIVSLTHENGKTTCYEVAFLDVSKEDEQKGITMEDLAKKNGVVFPRTMKEQDNDDDWPGLEKTINTAIDAFEKGIWK